MNNFTVYGLNQKDEWKKIRSSFLQADVYSLPEYTESFYINGDGEPLCIYYEQGEFKAMNIVMKRSVPNPNNKPELVQFYDFVTPYGYGGFLVSDPEDQGAIDTLAKEYSKFCEEQNIVSEFVRFHPVLNNAHIVAPIYEVVDLGHTVCLDTSTPEIIWQNITSKNRNMIRKAEKNGVEIATGNSEELYRSFEEIYNDTMRKVNAEEYYFFSSKFYDSIRTSLRDNSLLFYAVKENEIIAMSMILYTEGAMHYHLSASKREFQTYAPTNLILYRAACWGAERGMKTFHLGGGLGSHEDHLYHFKKEFNRGEDTQFCIGRRIFNQECYDLLCKEVNADPDTGFFPRYRA